MANQNIGNVNQNLYEHSPANFFWHLSFALVHERMDTSIACKLSCNAQLALCLSGPLLPVVICRFRTRHRYSVKLDLIKKRIEVFDDVGRV